MRMRWCLKQIKYSIMVLFSSCLWYLLLVLPPKRTPTTRKERKVHMWMNLSLEGTSTIFLRVIRKNFPRPSRRNSVLLHSVIPCQTQTIVCKNDLWREFFCYIFMQTHLVAYMSDESFLWRDLPYKIDSFP